MKTRCPFGYLVFILQGCGIRTYLNAICQWQIAATSSKLVLFLRPGDYYGFGVQILKYADRFLFGHTGNDDPYHTAVFADKKIGYGVAVFIYTMFTALPQW